MVKRIFCVVVGSLLIASVSSFAVFGRDPHGDIPVYTFTGFIQWAESLRPPDVSIPLIDVSSWPSWIQWFGSGLNGILTALNGVSSFVSIVIYFFWQIGAFIFDPTVPR